MSCMWACLPWQGPTLYLNGIVSLSPLQLRRVKGVWLCLDGTCQLHFWQNDQGLLCAAVVPWGWNGDWIRVGTESKSGEENDPTTPAMNLTGKLTIMNLRLYKLGCPALPADLLQAFLLSDLSVFAICACISAVWSLFVCIFAMWFLCSFYLSYVCSCHLFFCVLTDFCMWPCYLISMSLRSCYLTCVCDLAIWPMWPCYLACVCDRAIWPMSVFSMLQLRRKPQVLEEKSHVPVSWKVIYHCFQVPLTWQSFFFFFNLMFCTLYFVIKSSFALFTLS